MGGISFICYNNKTFNITIDFLYQFMKTKYRGIGETTQVIENTPDLADLNYNQISMELTKHEIQTYKTFTYFFNFHRMKINDSTFNASQPFENPIKTMFNLYPHSRYRPIRKLLCNGEIYNYIDLKNNFNVLELSSECDVEIILPLYIEKQGDIIETLKLLDGEFAMILTDNITSYNMKNTYVYAARDYLGIKPLYYITNNSNNFYMFVSEIKEIPLFILNNNSYFISQVPPGSIWSFKNPNEFIIYDDINNLKSLESCTINSFNPDVLNNIYENIREKINNAVLSRYSNCCNSEKTFGILLAGFDSCLMTSVLIKELVKLEHDFIKCPIYLFTIGDTLGGEDLDTYCSTEYIKFISEMYPNIHFHHHIININNIEILTSDIEKIIYHLETFDPETIRESIIYFYLFKYISEKTLVKVLLTGDGLDELGGYSNFNDLNDILFQEKSVELLLNLCNFDILRSDRISNAFSLELRHPFLQKDFVKYMLSIHPIIKKSQIYKNTEVPIEKYIIRKSFDYSVSGFNYLPSSILWRRSKCICDNLTNFEIRLNVYFDNLLNEQSYNILLKKYQINDTKQHIYYRDIFNKFFPNRDYLVKQFWNNIWD